MKYGRGITKNSLLGAGGLASYILLVSLCILRAVRAGRGLRVESTPRHQRPPNQEGKSKVLQRSPAGPPLSRPSFSFLSQSSPHAHPSSTSALLPPSLTLPLPDSLSPSLVPSLPADGNCQVHLVKFQVFLFIFSC